MLVLGAVWLFARGWRTGEPAWRFTSFAGGIAVALLAVVSPIDGLAGVLLSGHMVQHVLLVAVAAPLLALADPGPILLRGTPVAVRRRLPTVRRRLGLGVDEMRRLRHPFGRWLVYVGTFWLWHAALLYELAVDVPIVHALEHATMLAAALAIWSVIVGSRRARVDRGVGVLLAFLLVLQGVVLSTLFTFSTVPWYEPYAAPATGWGLDPLTDQRLAGVIMWIPVGAVYTATGLALAVTWIGEHLRPADV